MIEFLDSNSNSNFWRINSMKMLPLPTNQRVLTWLCIRPMNTDENRWKKLFYIMFSITFVSMDLTGLFSSVAFFLINISTDLEESLYALFQISAFSGLTYMCIVAFLLRNEITAFLGTLSQIYDARKKLNISDNFFLWDKVLVECDFHWIQMQTKIQSGF